MCGFVDVFLMKYKDSREQAKRIINLFSSKYNTPQNPSGKHFIYVYGGRWQQREKLAEALRMCLPFEAFVLDLPERVSDDRAFYVSAERFFERVRVPKAA
jgi:hypothetical protein